MLKNKWLHITILMMSMIFITTTVNTFAEEGLGFEVRAIHSSTQIDRELGYYYVQTDPGESQNIKVAVSNTSDKEKKIELVVENGISQSNGNIGYSSDLEKIDDTLKNPITEILIPDEKVFSIPPGEEKIATLKLNPPATKYEGVKVGQIIIREFNDSDKSGVGEVYQYSLGFVTSETGEPFNDGNQLDFGDVTPSVVNGQRVVALSIVNPEPKLIEGLQVDSYVTEKGDKSRIKEVQIKNFSFAPNSKVDFLLPWGLSNFTSGDYTYYFTAKNEYDSFQYEKDFTIRGNDAKNLNNETAFSVITPNSIKIAIISINLLSVIIFIFIILRNKKWMGQIRKQRKNKGKGRKKN